MNSHLNHWNGIITKCEGWDHTFMWAGTRKQPRCCSTMIAWLCWEKFKAKPCWNETSLQGRGCVTGGSPSWGAGEAPWLQLSWVLCMAADTALARYVPPWDFSRAWEEKVAFFFCLWLCQRQLWRQVFPVVSNGRYQEIFWHFSHGRRNGCDGGPNVQRINFAVTCCGTGLYYLHRLPLKG